MLLFWHTFQVGVGSQGRCCLGSHVNLATPLFLSITGRVIDFHQSAARCAVHKLGISSWKLYINGHGHQLKQSC